MKLTDRVYLIGGAAYGLSAQGDCNVYMVDCGDRLAVVDTGGGHGVPDMLRNMSRMGFDPGKVEVAYNTHCHYDHIGGNKLLKEATGCKIAAHKEDRWEIENLGPVSLYNMALDNGLSFEPTSVDISLAGDQDVEVGDVSFRVLHTPGHTPGGVSFVIEEGDAVSLFPGDTASAIGRLGFINGPGFVLPQWKRSIERMISVKPDRMFPGHGVFVVSGALEHLNLLDQNMNSPWINIEVMQGYSYKKS
jgi:glyoxylase-like metal-dependent hydrolase (beta-lactamase superfamily II)